MLLFTNKGLFWVCFIDYTYLFDKVRVPAHSKIVVLSPFSSRRFYQSPHCARTDAPLVFATSPRAVVVVAAFPRNKPRISVPPLINYFSSFQELSFAL
jgi:hypothetical protein